MFDTFRAMTNCDDVTIMAAVHFVSIEILEQFANRCFSKCLFHCANAGMAKEFEHRAMAVVPFLAELIKPLNDQRRYAPLLGALCGV